MATQDSLGSGSRPALMQITETAEDSVLVVLSGDWTMARSRPAATEFLETLENRPQLRSVAFDTTLLSDWDSSFVSFLLQVLHLCRDHHISAQRDGLPEGALQLIALAGAVPEQKEARKTPIRLSFLSRVGTSVLDWREEARAMASFVGEAALAMVNLARGRARFRRADLGLLLQECGPQALPIVSLISVLVGLILAFVGAIQLRLFGAQIYVADLVGLGMAREMGAMMTAIIMAGRTGAAFAAQLGTMQVNEEIDALRTLGLSPIEFLVLPRILALVLMMPLLCLYADFMGILGGAAVGVVMLDLSAAEYFHETTLAVGPVDFHAGLFKSVVFAVVVAFAGCLRGMQCGRSSSAVGEATTSAVVTSIVLIVVTDALLTVIYDILGI